MAEDTAPKPQAPKPPPPKPPEETPKPPEETPKVEAKLVNCVCTDKCYIPDAAGVIKIRYVGDVVQFFDNAVPPWFKPLDAPSYSVDYAKASEAELLAAEWTLEEAQQAMQSLYKTALKASPADDKQSVINKILDIRFRAI